MAELPAQAGNGSESSPKQLRLPAALVFCVGAALTGAAFVGTRDLERERVESGFREAATQPAAAVQRSIDLYVEDLQSIERFYAASQLVERDEFGAFVADIPTRRPAMEALAWVPEVRASERASLEAVAVQEGLPHLRISEADDGGALVPASDRSIYYPLWYVEPVEGHDSLLGLDLGSIPAALQLLEAVRDTGETSVTREVGLLDSAGGRATAAVVVRIHRHDPPGSDVSETGERTLPGFVVGFLRLQDLVPEAVRDSELPGTEVSLYDGPVEQGGQLLAAAIAGVEGAQELPGAGEQGRPNDGLRYAADVTVPGQQGWLVVCRPGARYLAAARPRGAWGVLVLGLLLTGLITAYVLTVTGRAAWAERVVVQRTADLSRANDELQREIEQRERFEEALQKSEEQYRLLVERMNEGLSILDEGGRFVYANDALTRMLGYSRDELMGHTPAEFMDETNRRILLDQLERRRRGEEAHYELSYTSRQGQQVHTIVSPTPLRDASGTYTGTFAVVTDITQRKQAEEQLEHMSAELRRSNAELEQFAYVASHDLQEPLRKIVAFGDRLAAKCGDALTAQGQDYLERMQSAAQRMQTLINDLLMYSRVTTRGQPFEPVDLAQVAHEVLSDLEVRVQETKAEVEVGPLPTIDADPAQMRQLLQNLISNALKFRRKDVPPIVKVGSRLLTPLGPAEPDSPRAAGQCEITVEDNGIGFDRKHRERIFGVFQRLHGRSEYEGTGIGLAICRRVAQRHGGSITVESAPGKGSKFIVTLPIRQSREDAPHE